MKLKAGEKGFTLIELLVGIAIAVFVVGAASMTVITMMRLSPQSNNWAIALRQVQNTGYWISRDVQMSQGNIDIDPDPDTFLTLTVPEWDEDSGAVVPKQFVYEFEDMSGERWLVRTESIGGSIVGQTAIAQYISMPDTTAIYNYDAPSQIGTLTFTIKAISGNVPVTRDYEAAQRVPAP
ncbi:MAG: prepilin-type N-terminal cleavage/methylation domain-containing protein [Chloroflexi bacterium]|nr:prepilin-type N-terminal cleavage/methylation domain-containing protein [Chloroflexota bacterium]